MSETPTHSLWRRIDAPNAPKGRSSHSVTVIPNERRVYVYGGEDVPRRAFDPHMHYYDLNSNSWNTIDSKSQPPSRLAHTAAAVGDDIYVYGGRKTHGDQSIYDTEEDFDLDEFWRFNTKKGEWEKVEYGNVGPGRRSYHAMAAGPDAVYVFAGCHGHDRMNDLWKYTPATAKWEQLGESSAKKPAIRGGPALAVSGDSVYVHGGYQGATLGESDELWVFDQKTGQWESVHESESSDEKRSRRPQARSVHSIVPVKSRDGKDRLFSWGGEGTASKTGHMGAGEYWSDGWYYGINDKTWEESESDESRKRQEESKAVRPSPRGWFAMDKLDDNHVALFGGFDGTKGDERLGDLYIFETN